MAGPDYGRLKATLANSKMQQDNNALYQTVLGLINGVQQFQKEIEAMLAEIVTINNTLGSLELIGDVIGGPSASPISTTIIPGAVTYPKIQNISTANKLLGRGSSGSGIVQEINLGSGLTMVGTTLNSLGGAYMPLTLGDDPPTFVTDGAGQLIMIAFTP